MAFPKDIYTSVELGGEAANFKRTTLTAAITTASTTIPVTSTTGFPDGTSLYCFISIGAVGVDAEIIRYTSVDATNFYCSGTGDRAADGGTAYAHAINDYVRLAYPAEIHNRNCTVLADIQTFVRDDGLSAIKAQAAEDLYAYEVVAFDGDGKFVKADASSSTLCYIQGILPYDIDRDAYGIAVEGFITNTEWGWTAQRKLWLSATQPGQLQATEPSSGYAVCCAFTASSTKIRFKIPSWDLIAQFSG